jgi:hypothetical protein
MGRNAKPNNYNIVLICRPHLSKMNMDDAELSVLNA